MAKRGLLIGSVETIRYSPPNGNYGESCFITLDGGVQIIAGGVKPQELPKLGRWAVFEVQTSRKGSLLLQSWGWPVFGGKSLNKDEKIFNYKPVKDLRGDEVGADVGMDEV